MPVKIYEIVSRKKNPTREVFAKITPSTDLKTVKNFNFRFSWVLFLFHGKNPNVFY